MKYLRYIIYMYIISLISCDIPSFEITEVYHTNTRCDRENGFIQFDIKGTGKNIKDEIRITLPVQSPENYKAVCIVNSTDIYCKMDALIYDLSGAQKLILFKEPPVFENFEISNWEEYFIEENLVLTSSTNCAPDERKEPEEGEEEQIFAAYDAKNIEILGCFRNKNNFSFQLTKVKDGNNTLDEFLNQDIYFEIFFEKPKNEKALCVIPKKSINNVHTVRCAIDYGGEIEIGGEADGTVMLDDKKYKIVFRGFLIPPTIVDECSEEKNNFK